MVNARQITWAAMYLYAVSFFILIEVVAADSSSTADEKVRFCMQFVSDEASRAIRLCLRESNLESLVTLVELPPSMRRSIRSNNKQCVSILVCRIPMRIDTHLLLSDRIGLRHTINKTYNNQQKLLTDT
ncbi:hypothetical protein Y032_0016g3102 [Ancylostoma ceylanicum]|uniref:Uncharacterized protein n=1 Tax=Ancylostoma ceylanicum TaxID=53326 RepID=A0A016V7V0_9BILA|nr:hypothetical protein Y032_0016g3102 [Ancylostoma ceylanicum]